jgi:hypothetical protein
MSAPLSRPKSRRICGLWLRNEPGWHERIERRLGRRDHFDVEALEQRSRAKLGSGEMVIDVIEQPVRRLGSEPFPDA